MKESCSVCCFKGGYGNQWDYVHSCTHEDHEFNIYEDLECSVCDDFSPNKDYKLEEVKKSCGFRTIK